MQYYITNFSSLSLNSLKVSGRKAASLGELVHAGFPVPAGFVIVGQAFEDYLRECALRPSIEASLDGKKVYESLVSPCEAIRSKITSGHMTTRMAHEIVEAYDNLGCDRVAIRSSATVEDSQTASWSGQLDTFLNTDRGALLSNVIKCWASLFKPITVLYGINHGTSILQVSMGVIVQEMVDADVSGVAFTIHPESRDRNLMIIEAGWGLGESIVQGRIIPDLYVVDKRDRVIVDLRIGNQYEMLVRDEKCRQLNALATVPSDQQQKQKLTGEQITELADLCIRVEQHLGTPSDIEWARSKESFFVIQSRPITTL
jgi:pyruvate,water dikinase